jgi:uncharacterized membrane protein
MTSAPRLLPWLLSLLTLGIFWLGQQTQLNQLERSNRDLTWLHFVFLAVVTALPFSARLLADFLEYRTAFLVYWFNIVLLGASLYATWAYAEWAWDHVDHADPGQLRDWAEATDSPTPLTTSRANCIWVEPSLRAKRSNPES